jgi:hypothetical protein
MLLETTALGRTAARIMEQATFAEHYRICAKGDGSPRELSRTGSAITCKAKDIRSGEPVALKLIPNRRSYRRAGSFQFDGCGACSSDGAHS